MNLSILVDCIFVKTYVRMTNLTYFVTLFLFISMLSLSNSCRIVESIIRNGNQKINTGSKSVSQAPGEDVKYVYNKVYNMLTI